MLSTLSPLSLSPQRVTVFPPSKTTLSHPKSHGPVLLRTGLDLAAPRLRRLAVAQASPASLRTFSPETSPSHTALYSAQPSRAALPLGSFPRPPKWFLGNFLPHPHFQDPFSRDQGLPAPRPCLLSLPLSPLSSPWRAHRCLKFHILKNGTYIAPVETSHPPGR